MLATAITSIILAVNPGGTAPDTHPPVRVKRSYPQPHRAQSRCRNLGHFKATAYGPPWGGLEGGDMTATGARLQRGRHIIAVDPRRIRLGSLIKIWPNPLGYRGPFLAADVGGAILGRHIDIFTWHGARAKDHWGVRRVHLCLIGMRR